MQKKAMMTSKNTHFETHAVTPANGTDDREAHPKRWIAVLVQVRSEKAVGKKLTDLHIENYVPTQWEIHQWSDRRKKVERVVIPMVAVRIECLGYACVSIDRSDITAIQPQIKNIPIL